MRGKKLTPEEKNMIVSVHTNLKSLDAQISHQRTQGLRETVAELVNVGVGTVGAVIAEYNKSGCVAFSTAPKAVTLRRQSQIAEIYGEDIRSIIRDRNLRGLPVSARHVTFELKVSKGVTIPRRTMRHVIRRLGFRYIKGTTRHILAESSG
jgi:transposase